VSGRGCRSGGWSWQRGRRWRSGQRYEVQHARQRRAWRADWWWCWRVFGRGSYGRWRWRWLHRRRWRCDYHQSRRRRWRGLQLRSRGRGICDGQPGPGCGGRNLVDDVDGQVAPAPAPRLSGGIRPAAVGARRHGKPLIAPAEKRRNRFQMGAAGRRGTPRPVIAAAAAVSLGGRTSTSYWRLLVIREERTNFGASTPASASTPAAARSAPGSVANAASARGGAGSPWDSSCHRRWGWQAAR
jgi:hypothetical protein